MHEQPLARRIDLTLLDFSCAVGARYLDVQAEGRGEVSRWLKPYDSDANLRLVQTSFGRNRVPIPADAAGPVGRFPDRFRCHDGAP